MPQINQDIRNTLKKDIETWIQGNKQAISNERDLQVKLAIELEKSCHYDEVCTEYSVPVEALVAKNVSIPLKKDNKAKFTHFPWHNRVISLDIVVRIADKYAVLELKYFTRPIQLPTTLFNEYPIQTALKDKAAIDVVSYDYCTDIRRIEVMKSTFLDVAAGIALLIANNHNLWDAPSPEVLYSPFSLQEGNCFSKGLHEWSERGSKKFKAEHPPFETSADYNWRWLPTAIPYIATGKNKETFKYLLTII